MDEIITERSESVLRVQLNRPMKRNAMTSRMYAMLADVFKNAATDEYTRVVLWHGAGDSFSAGNDIQDFLKNPPGSEDSPQARLMNALVDLSEDDLIAHCRRFLANFKIPRHIEFSETELPKSGSGKILKRLLRERLWVGQKRAVA